MGNLRSFNVFAIFQTKKILNLAVLEKCCPWYYCGSLTAGEPQMIDRTSNDRQSMLFFGYSVEIQYLYFCDFLSLFTSSQFRMNDERMHYGCWLSAGYLVL